MQMNITWLKNFSWGETDQSLVRDFPISRYVISGAIIRDGDRKSVSFLVLGLSQSL